jgi:hypothetical protein
MPFKHIEAVSALIGVGFAPESITVGISGDAKQTTAVFKDGSKIEGNYRGKGKWYPGKIRRDRGDGTFDLSYDDGEEETKVSKDNVRSRGGGSTTSTGATAASAVKNEKSSAASSVAVSSSAPTESLQPESSIAALRFQRSSFMTFTQPVATVAETAKDGEKTPGE